MKRTVVVLTVAGLALAGCGSSPDTGNSRNTAKVLTQSTPPSPPSTARPQVMKFGEDVKGNRGVINVSSPAPYDLPQDPARPKDLTRGLKFVVKIKNTNQQPLQATAFSFSAAVGGNPAKLVIDAQNQVGDKLKADILPGKEGGLTLVAAAPATPSDITVKVQFDGAKPFYWNGTV